MQRPSWAPEEIDVDRPSAARVYDYYLGGLHNFSADRDMAARAVADWPELPRIMQANRAFLRRAVRHLAAQGIDQFLDIGSGIPTAGNVHEVAGLLEGFTLDEPGIVYLPQWRPDDPSVPLENPERFTGHAAVGRRD